MRYYIDQIDQYNVRIENQTDFAKLQSGALVPEKGAIYHYGEYHFKLRTTSKDLFLVRKTGSFRLLRFQGLDSLVEFLQKPTTPQGSTYEV